MIALQLRTGPLPAQGNAATAALEAHIATLARELERAHQRAEALAAQLQAVWDERFFRPVVTSAGSGDEPARPAATPPAFIAEEMNDIPVYDPEAEARALANEEREWQEQFQARIRAREAQPAATAGETPSEGRS